MTETTDKEASTLHRLLEIGKIEEEGNHEELLNKNGLYKEMWDNYQTSISWKVGENV